MPKVIRTKPDKLALCLSQILLNQELLATANNQLAVMDTQEEIDKQTAYLARMNLSTTVLMNFAIALNCDHKYTHIDCVLANGIDIIECVKCMRRIEIQCPDIILAR